MALTKKQVERLVAKGEPAFVGDGHGLYLQVLSKGNSSWVYRYELTVRDETGAPIMNARGTRPRVKEHNLGLGPTHTFDLDEARELAREQRKLRARGLDPATERRQQKAARRAQAAEAAKALTFRQAAEQFFASKSPQWRNAKHQAQFGSSLEAYAYPLIGALPVKEIDTPLVLKVLNQPLKDAGGERFWLAKNETATRVRRRIEWVLSWAAVSKHRTGENAARWRGHLDHVLPSPSDLRKVKHHPALPWKQVPAFMAALKAREGVAARALELLILCANRTSEITQARWSEFDLKAKLWVIPPERMKAGREHRIPLSAEAIALLKELPRETNNPFVFLGARAGQPISDMSLTMTLRRMGFGHVSPHGFRSSFREWAAQSGHSREAAELALAHAVAGASERSYWRSDMLEQRITLMKGWAAFATGPAPAEEDEPEADNVVGMSGAGR